MSAIVTTQPKRVIRRAGASTVMLAALLGAGSGIALDTISATIASAATIDSLTSGGTMHGGDVLRSPSGQINMTMQGDGNLVIYRTTGPSTRAVVWHTNTPQQPGAYVVNQGDGNLVIYKPLSNNQRVAIWQSGTGGRGPARLLMQDDQNLVLYSDADGKATWSSNTSVINAGPTSVSGLRRDIITVALGEVGLARATEGAENCNYYSSQVSSAATKNCTTPSGQPGKPEAWCAQFARWVYKTAGAGNYDRMDAGARSVKNYGTWKNNPSNNVTGIQPGDLIGFKLNTGTPNDDHVGIVVEVNGTSLTTVEGNTGSGKVTKVTNRKVTDSTISGYATPTAR